MKVDILVTTGAEDGVLVDRDDAQIVGVLPQYLQLSHVGLVQLALRVFHLQRNLRFFYFCFSKHRGLSIRQKQCANNLGLTRSACLLAFS